jgi:multiple sugar transport system substrate-binding protein
MRSVIGILVALLLALPASAQTKLRFYSWQTDDQSNSVWWRAANKAFEQEHPGIAIDFVQVPRDRFADTMMVMFAANNAPEIVHLAAFEFQTFADQGWLEDLAPMIHADGLDLRDWAGQEKCSVGGKIVCINLNYFGYILYYNQALLKAAEVAVPTDWASYLEAARKITAAGHGQYYGIGLGTSSGGGQYLTELLVYVLDAGGYWVDKSGNPTIDTPQVIEGLRRWKLLQQQKLTPLGDKAEDVRQLFIEGRIGMRLDGPWMWGLLDTAKPDIRPSLEIAVPPETVPVGGTSNVIAMPTGLPQATKQLVWAYIKQITSQHWQEQYVALSGQLAPRPGSLTPEILRANPFLALFQKSQDAAAAAGVDRLPAGYETKYNEFARIVTEECQRMVIGDEDPATVAKRIQRRVVELKRS